MSYHEIGSSSQRYLIGSTMLKMSEREPWRYRRVYVDGVEEAPDLSGRLEVQIGTVVHGVILEDKEIDSVMRRIPDDCLKSNGYINPVRLAEYREEVGECLLLKLEEYERVLEIIGSLRSSGYADRLSGMGTEREQPIFWTDASGLECKGRLDIWDVVTGTVYDLKISEGVDPESFGRLSKKLKYWIQDCHYRAGVRSVYGLEEVSFKFLVQESVYPYRIAEYEYDSISRERGDEAYRMLMNRLSRRYRDNYWDSDWEHGVNDLSLEPWELGVDMEGELEGFDD